MAAARQQKARFVVFSFQGRKTILAHCSCQDGGGGLSAKGAEDREVDQNVVAMPVQLRGLLVDTAIDPEDRAQKRSGEGKLLAAEARQLGDF